MEKITKKYIMFFNGFEREFKEPENPIAAVGFTRNPTQSPPYSRDLYKQNAPEKLRKNIQYKGDWRQRSHILRPNRHCGGNL